MAEVQQTATTAKNPYAPNPYRSKFKATIAEMKRKKEDPQFIRYVMDQEGYDVSLVDQELANLQSYESGEPITSMKPNKNAIPGENIDQNLLAEGQRTALLYGQRMYQSGKILDQQDETIANKGLIDSFKQSAAEKAVGGTITGQFVDDEFKKYDQAKRDFINASLRRESGAVISDVEFENANKQYFPVPGDSKEVLAQKKANRELQARGFLKSAGVTDAEINFDDQSTQDVQGGQQNDQLTQAKAWLEANPNDERAEKVRAKIAQMEGTVSDVPVATENGAGTDFTAMGGAVGDKLGSFFGGNKIGEAIGNVVGGQMAKFGDAGRIMQENLANIAQLKSEGKLDDEKYNMLVDTLEKTAKEAFGYNGPSFKEVAGDALKVGTTFLGGGAVRGATLATTAARTAAVGASYSAGNALAEDKDARGVIIDSLIGGTVAGAIPVVGKVLGKGFQAVVGKNTPEEALGEILQGKTKDVKAGQRALAVLDTKGVKTYDDLAAKLDDSISYLSGKVDEVLGKDTVLTPLSQLVTSTKSKGGKVIETNFVQKALEHLDELYTKTGDNVSAQNIKELFQKASTQGLSKAEVNQIAREYGMANKSFTKFGEQMTSVNAKLYENTRSGLKEIARKGLNGEVAKNLDSLISDSIHTRELIEKNMEAVNRLEQRAEKMGLGRTVITKAIRALDVATLGGTRALRESLIQSNVGKKTMNAIDIESKLQGNLKIIEKALKANTPGALEKALQDLNKRILNSVKGKGGLSIQDITPRGAEARKKLKELTEKMGSAKTEAIKKRYAKAIQELINREK